jgi:UDP-glucose 4-epimerase
MLVITGGAGFIGSNLTNYLIKKGEKIIVIDNLSSGNILNLKQSSKNKNFRFIKKNVLDTNLSPTFKDAESIYHLAADPSVQISSKDPKRNFRLNAMATFNVLEAARKSDAKEIIFASSSTVYGEAKKFPTPEEYPLQPISNYGASKVACESYISSYAYTYGIKGVVLRLANIFGPMSTHGVIFDFFNKLKKNPRELLILGDGRQNKSYLYISDCIGAMLIARNKQKEIFDVFNVGSKEMLQVNKIARIVCNHLGLNPKFRYTGGKRGWSGDVTKMLLETKKIEKLGWKEKTSFEDGAKKYFDWLNSSTH